MNEWLSMHYKNKMGPTIKEYGDWKMYALSKACNIIFALHLHNLYCNNGLISVSLHPGTIPTNIMQNKTWAHTAMHSVGKFFMKTYVFLSLSLFLSFFVCFVGCMHNNYVLLKKLKVAYYIFIEKKQTKKSVYQGASTTIRCLTMPENEINGGGYYCDCKDNTKNVRKDIWNQNNNNGILLFKLTQVLVTQKGFLLEINNNNHNISNIHINCNVLNLKNHNNDNNNDNNNNNHSDQLEYKQCENDT